MPIRVRLTVTVPKEIMNFNAVREAIASAQRRKTAPRMKQLFSQTVDGWEHRPEWSQKQSVQPSRISISVWASGKYENQYRIVNEGAKPHKIRPLNPRGLLRFQPGYISATRPGSLKSFKPYRFGNFIGVRGVSHPGFEPRYFDVQIADVTGEDFVRDMQEAIKVGALVGRTASTPGF